MKQPFFVRAVVLLSTIGLFSASPQANAANWLKGCLAKLGGLRAPVQTTENAVVPVSPKAAHREDDLASTKGATSGLLGDTVARAVAPLPRDEMMRIWQHQVLPKIINRFGTIPVEIHWTALDGTTIAGTYMGETPEFFVIEQRGRVNLYRRNDILGDRNELVAPPTTAEFTRPRPQTPTTSTSQTTQSLKNGIVLTSTQTLAFPKAKDTSSLHFMAPAEELFIDQEYGAVRASENKTGSVIGETPQSLFAAHTDPGNKYADVLRNADRRVVYSVINGEQKGHITLRNEDGFLVTRTHDSHDLFLIADGIGGGNGAGVTATDAIVKSVEKSIKRGSSVDDALTEAKKSLEVAFKGNPEKNDQIGATLASVEIFANQVIFRHIGDARAVQFRENMIEHQTLDHSYVRETLGLNADQALLHEDNNIITKSLGVDENGVVRRDEVEKEFRDLQGGDRFVLASDGVWDYLKISEVQQIVFLAKTPKEAAEKIRAALPLAAEKLTAAGFDKSSQDNVSIVVVFTKKAGI